MHPSQSFVCVNCGKGVQDCNANIMHSSSISTTAVHCTVDKQYYCTVQQYCCAYTSEISMGPLGNGTFGVTALFELSHSHTISYRNNKNCPIPITVIFFCHIPAGKITVKISQIPRFLGTAVTITGTFTKSQLPHGNTYCITAIQKQCP